MMRLVGKYVDVAHPSEVVAILRFRSWDEAEADWGTLYKEHHKPFGPQTIDNIVEAREWVNLFQIGEPE